MILANFAKATRYYNLDYIGGGAKNHVDPIRAWWEEVAEKILARHTDARTQKARAQAKIVDVLAASSVDVMHTAEDGSPITGLGSLIARGAESLVVQRYGSLYALQIVRWISFLVHDLSQYAGYTMRIDGLFGVYERVRLFMRSDARLRRKRRWSLYG